MKNLLIIALILLSFGNVYSQSGLSTRNVITGLDTPWEILWGPDNFIWMTERYGRISRVNPESGKLTELINIEGVFEDGERGLMGMVLHPDFTNNPYAYTVYTYHGNGTDTWVKLIRLTYDGKKLSSPVVLLDSIRGAWNHDGSRLMIDENLKLFMTMGDGAIGASAQDKSVLNGKILRMNLNGTKPADNPIQNSYVWSWGHRNPQGLVKANGIIYSSEHGPDRDDELNIIEKDRNYGWPNVNGFCNTPDEKQFCTANNVKEPIAAWTPTLAVAGIDYYKHNLIQEWNNSILMVVLKSTRLVQMKLSEDGLSVLEENQYFTNQFGRLRDICISPDGRVFIATSNKDGRGDPAKEDDRIIEIKPTTSGVKGLKKNDGQIEIYPNPFNESVFIKAGDNSEIEILNSIGETVRKLQSNNDIFIWDGTDDRTNALPNGLYFVRIKFKDNYKTEKIILNK